MSLTHLNKTKLHQIS